MPIVVDHSPFPQMRQMAQQAGIEEYRRARVLELLAQQEEDRRRMESMAEIEDRRARLQEFRLGQQERRDTERADQQFNRNILMGAGGAGIMPGEWDPNRPGMPGRPGQQQTPGPRPFQTDATGGIPQSLPQPQQAETAPTYNGPPLFPGHANFQIPEGTSAAAMDPYARVVFAQRAKQQQEQRRGQVLMQRMGEEMQAGRLSTQAMQRIQAAPTVEDGERMLADMVDRSIVIEEYGARFDSLATDPYTPIPRNILSNIAEDFKMGVLDEAGMVKAIREAKQVHIEAMQEKLEKIAREKIARALASGDAVAALQAFAEAGETAPAAIQEAALNQAMGPKGIGYDRAGFLAAAKSNDPDAALATFDDPAKAPAGLQGSAFKAPEATEDIGAATNAIFGALRQQYPKGDPGVMRGTAEMMARGFSVDRPEVSISGEDREKPFDLTAAVDDDPEVILAKATLEAAESALKNAPADKKAQWRKHLADAHERHTKAVADAVKKANRGSEKAAPAAAPSPKDAKLTPDEFKAGMRDILK